MALKDITVRLLTEEDMAEVSEWFAARKWPVPPGGKMLPETGYVAELDGRMISVAWLYITNSEVGIIDWIATNPEAGARGIISVKKLIEHIEGVSLGSLNTFMHFTPNDRLAQYLKKKCGFKVTEKSNVCIRKGAAQAQGVV